MAKETDKERLERLTGEYLKELYTATVESVKEHITTVNLTPAPSDRAINADIAMMSPADFNRVSQEVGAENLAIFMKERTAKWRK